MREENLLVGKQYTGKHHLLLLLCNARQPLRKEKNDIHSEISRTLIYIISVASTK